MFLRPSVTPQTAVEHVLRSCRLFPTRPAISVGDTTLSYAALLARAKTISAMISQMRQGQETASIALLPSRSIDDYAAVLAVFLSGLTYVPLNGRNPLARSLDQLTQSCAGLVLAAHPSEPLVDLCAMARVRPLIMEALETGPTPPIAPTPAQTAYIMSTSGSTGTPKLVPISQDNLSAYLHAALSCLLVTSQDRLSQVFDLSFDLSLHDIFISWSRGAHLIVADDADLADLARFIQRGRITHWFSTPSHARKILARTPDPARFASLRLSMFCGEALDWSLAARWAELTKAPIENWYGPTETTIAATRYRLPSHRGKNRTHFVPIGKPLPAMSAQLVPTDPEANAPAQYILQLCGPQVFSGYLNHAQPAPDAPYLTGDLVQQDSRKDLHFRGRQDQQIKLNGQRIELAEVERALARHVQSAKCIALPWPFRSAQPSAIIGVVEGETSLSQLKIADLRQHLPPSLCPHRLISVAEFPLSASGKIDRTALAKTVAQQIQSQDPGTIIRPQKRFDHLIAMAQSLAPHLSRAELSAPVPLLEAGLDSLAFTGFVALIEKRFQIALTQEDVASLAHMTLRQIVVFIRQRREAKFGRHYKLPNREIPLRALRGKRHYRAMRALDFLEKFPSVLREAPGDLIPFVGSSGFMRAIDPDVVQRHPFFPSQTTTALNIGMAMLSNRGIAEFCHFIRDTAQAQGKRFPLAVLELELLQLSVLPPAGDIEILNDFKSGVFDRVPRHYFDPDTVWDVPGRGKIAPKLGPEPRVFAHAIPDAPARWESQRNDEIRQVFAGKIPFDAKAIDLWMSGLSALAEVSDKIAVCLHPLDGFSSLASQKSRHLDAVIRRIEAIPGLALYLDETFSLSPDMFRNFTHVNATSGRQAFSEQLANALFAR